MYKITANQREVSRAVFCIKSPSDPLDSFLLVLFYTYYYYAVHIQTFFSVTKERDKNTRSFKKNQLYLVKWLFFFLPVFYACAFK